MSQVKNCCSMPYPPNLPVVFWSVLISIVIFLSLLLSALHVVEIKYVIMLTCHQYSNFGLKYRTLDYTVTDQIYGSGRTFSGKLVWVDEGARDRYVIHIVPDDIHNIRFLVGEGCRCKRA